ncbi:MAG TPA: DNA-processing protein DprA [Ktedonobacteraceae bacterium]|nr:DNA-processing protein DprA [Ktedonobacteraceae bacterium]
MYEASVEQAYWFLLAFESRLSTRVINRVIANWLQEGRTLQDFFAADPQAWSNICQLQKKHIEKLLQLRANAVPPQGMPLPLAQLLYIKQLERENIHILPVLDAGYPALLKSVLKAEQLPPALCYLGNLSILEHPTVAIIGVRDAGEESLSFTREVACYLVEHSVTIISGNARGIDSAALEGTMNAHGSIVLVLPHGLRKLHKVERQKLQAGIETGHILLLSQFHPDAPWLISRAMERNKIVTGLAQAVIVAESGIQGGTWEGANGALKQERPLYVRQTDTADSPSGNTLLLEKGGIPLAWPMQNIAAAPLLLLEENQQGHLSDITKMLLHT